MPTISSTTFQDPKPFNTVSLINQRNHIKELIDNGLHNKAFIEMCSLVCEFEIDQKDTPMLELKKKLIDNVKRAFLTCAESIDYYDKICMFMNGTYCRGFKAQVTEEFFPTLDEEEQGNDGK